MPDKHRSPAPKGTAASGRTILAKNGRLTTPEPVEGGAPEPDEQVPSPPRPDGSEWTRGEHGERACDHCGLKVAPRSAGMAAEMACAGGIHYWRFNRVRGRWERMWR